jgi:hypothetical protein
MKVEMESKLSLQTTISKKPSRNITESEKIESNSLVDHGYSTRTIHHNSSYKFLQTLCYVVFYLRLSFNITSSTH